MDWLRENWKKILLVIGFVALVILIGFLIWWLFFGGSKKTPEAPPPEMVIPKAELPQASDRALQPPKTVIPGTPPSVITKQIIPKTAEEARGGPVQVTKIDDGSTAGLHLDTSGNGVVAFDEFSGVFYRITPDGEKEQLTDQTFIGAQSISWAPKGDKAAIQFPDAANIVYDFEQKKQTTLPAHWWEPSFAPSGGEISFKSIAEDPDNRWFAVANADGTGARALESLGLEAGMFAPSFSPSGQVAGFFREGLDGDRQKLYLIGLNDERWKTITIAGRGLETQWSPSGDRLLHSVYASTSGYRPELWIVDAIGDSIGQNRRRLRLNTWAHKCAFADNTTIYCAVPDTLPEGAGLVPSWGDAGEDSFWRVSIANGERTKLASPPEKHTVEQIAVSKDQSMLYFTDKATGNLYSMKLR